MASSLDGRVYWYSNNGRADNFTGADAVEIYNDVDPATFLPIYAEDMDGDGDKDIILGIDNPDEGCVRIHHNSNDDKGRPGSFTKDDEVIVFRDILGVSAVAAADMDGDGDMDVVASSWYDTSIRWFRNRNGLANNFTKADVVVVSNTIKLIESIFLVDMDGDRDIDIVCGGISSADGLQWFRSDKFGSNFQKVPFGSGSDPVNSG